MKNTTKKLMKDKFPETFNKKVDSYYKMSKEKLMEICRCNRKVVDLRNVGKNDLVNMILEDTGWFN